MVYVQWSLWNNSLLEWFHFTLEHFRQDLLKFNDVLTLGEFSDSLNSDWSSPLMDCNWIRSVSWLSLYFNVASSSNTCEYSSASITTTSFPSICIVLTSCRLWKAEGRSKLASESKCLISREDRFDISSKTFSQLTVLVRLSCLLITFFVILIRSCWRCVTFYPLCVIIKWPILCTTSTIWAFFVLQNMINFLFV